MQTDQAINAHETTRKKLKQTNPQVLQKFPKTAKRGNSITIVKKIKQ